MIDKEDAASKKENLIHYLEKLDSLLVAFSGGVDSTFLLALSHQTLMDKVVAVTESSTTYPSREREEAIKFTKDRGIEHIVFQADETSIAEFVSNAPDRCYHCKKSLSKNLLNIAKQKSISHVAYAANLDDLSDYRPGMDAAREMGISNRIRCSANTQAYHFVNGNKTDVETRAGWHDGAALERNHGCAGKVTLALGAAHIGDHQIDTRHRFERSIKICQGWAAKQHHGVQLAHGAWQFRTAVLDIGSGLLDLLQAVLDTGSGLAHGHQLCSGLVAGGTLAFSSD